MASKYTDADRANAIELYLSGLSVHGVAEKTGLGKDFVNNALCKAGLKRDRSSARKKFYARGGQSANYRSDIDAEEVRREHDRGVPADEIARKLNVSSRLVGLRLKQAGSRMRTPAEARALIDREQSTARGAIGRTRKVGWGEDVLAEWLRDRGEAPDLQRPEGTRNIDIAVGSVAVEIWLSSSSPLADPYCRNRIEYLRDRGLTIVYVLVARRTRVLLPVVADQIVALAQLTRSDPSAPREHRVIRGCGEVAARFSDNFGDVALVPPAKDCPHHRVYTRSGDARLTG